MLPVMATVGTSIIAATKVVGGNKRRSEGGTGAW